MFQLLKRASASELLKFMWGREARDSVKESVSEPSFSRFDMTSRMTDCSVFQVSTIASAVFSTSSDMA